MESFQVLQSHFRISWGSSDPPRRERFLAIASYVYLSLSLFQKISTQPFLCQIHTHTHSIYVHQSQTHHNHHHHQLGDEGELVDGADVTEEDLDREEALNIYTTMVKLQTMDQIFYDAQRQGRISFYMQSAGEESASVGSASALSPEDMVFAQYREPVC